MIFLSKGQSSAEHHRGMHPRERNSMSEQQPPQQQYHRQAPPPTQPQAPAPSAAAAVVDKQTDENVLEQLRNKNRYNPEELDLSQVERAR